MNRKRDFLQHWAILCLGATVVLIFGVVLVTFEVKETEFAVLKRFGSSRKGPDGKVITYDPGLHFKIPFIDEVWKHDNRLQCYELKKGQVEQIQTRDEYQIVVTTYVLWRVGNPGLFLKRLSSTEKAEDKLDEVVRNSRSTVLGSHDLGELINTDPSKIRMAEIEQEMLDRVQATAREEYGIEVVRLGIKHLGFPEKVTLKVFDRMRAERRRHSQKYLAEGEREAQRIRANADRQASDILAQAQAKATQIRAEGDQMAAKHYAVFQKNPELAAFLRKLDALRLTLSKKTTMVLDTNTPPYDLLLPGATDLADPRSSRTDTGAE